MKKIDVIVNFEGTVSVMVPDHMSEEDSKLLASKVALARVLATTDNPDAPEEDALDQYEDECSSKAKKTSDKDWDTARADGVSGRWSLVSKIS